MHDANGTPIKVGDVVILQAVITDATPNEDYCNLTIRALRAAKPFSDPGAMRTFVVNAAQVVLVSTGGR